MRKFLLLIAVAPALALAATRGHKKPPKTAPKPIEPAPVTPDAGSGSNAKPVEPTPAPPAVAPATPAVSAGSAAPAAPTDEPPATNEPDVDALRQEYLALRDELFKSRARANAVASQLYSTRVSIKLAWTSARYYGVAKASIRLDGATVFEDATGAIGSDDGVRFDGYVAPGRHLVTFRVEATGKDDDSFTSSTETQVVVKAIANKDLVIAAKARDSGDIAYEWKRTEHGRYGLGIDVVVRAAAPAAEKKK